MCRTTYIVCSKLKYTHTHLHTYALTHIQTWLHTLKSMLVSQERISETVIKSRQTDLFTEYLCILWVYHMCLLPTKKSKPKQNGCYEVHSGGVCHTHQLFKTLIGVPQKKIYALPILGFHNAYSDSRVSEKVRNLQCVWLNITQHFPNFLIVGTLPPPFFWRAFSLNTTPWRV